MRLHEIRRMSEAELVQRLAELNEEIYNLRFQKATRQTTNPNRIRTLRREIAQIQTILQEHHLGIRSLSGAEAPSSGASVESGEQA